MPNRSDLFQCQKCGECCKGYGGAFVNEREIERISRYLDIASESFLRDYCQWSGRRPLIKTLASGYCVFWDKVCTIHKVKPRMCKLWPFIESMLIDTTNWAILQSMCPGIRGDVDPDDVVECVREAVAEYEKE
ncbi:MAG: YkgJ family cysteine cluster protein [Desulfobacterales bacterium]|nr:YkgJ family cysteine cluster protein [Desulfobacterales bacterium]